MQTTYGLIAICPYVSGYGLGARNRQAGLRCMGTPRSSSAFVVSDANGDVGALTRYPLHASPWASQ